VPPSGTEPDVRPADELRPADRFDVAVVGGGSAAVSLVRGLREHGARVVVFEEHRVGGQCPFVSCIPSKSMLHDGAVGASWREAVQRRARLVDDRDDASHAEQLVASGATLVRARAVLTDPGRLRAGGEEYTATHVVLATGSEPVIPPIEGIDDLGDRRWTSAEALVAEDRPTRLAVIGGGAVGSELATLFATFGTEVHLIDVAPRAFPELPPDVTEVVDDGLRARGVRVCRGTEVARLARRGGGVRTTLANGAGLDTDRVLVAAGRRPRTADLGLERVGVADPDRLTVDDTGRVAAHGSLWAIGDVAGRGQYTHVANHHAAVVVDALVGSGQRRFTDVVTPACVFTDPPLITVGPPPDALSEDDVVRVSGRLSQTARWATDDLGDGVLHLAVDRDTRCVVAAHGAGAGFDVLAATLVTLVDGAVPVDRLTRSMWPFPTIGEMLGVLCSRAVASLEAA
jgi:dihydrolipoamide dehydrogenase